jgi:hypothetical protein
VSVEPNFVGQIIGNGRQGGIKRHRIAIRVVTTHIAFGMAGRDGPIRSGPAFQGIVQRGACAAELPRQGLYTLSNTWPKSAHAPFYAYFWTSRFTSVLRRLLPFYLSIQFLNCQKYGSQISDGCLNETEK